MRWVLAGNDNRLYIDVPRYDSERKEWFLHLAKKYTKPRSKKSGAIVASISINQFEEIYKFFKLAQNRPVALYRSDGVLIASQPERAKLLGQRAPEITEDSINNLGNSVQIFTHAKGSDGREEHTLATVPNFPLLVSVVNDTDEVMASWRENSIPIILAVIFITVFIIVAAAMMSVRLVREKELQSRLEDATGLYEHTIDSVMDAIIATNGSQVITLFNKAAERMFGYKAEEVIGKSLDMLLPHRYRGMHKSHVAGFQGTNENFRLMEAKLGIWGLRKDGQEFPIESTISKNEIGGQVQMTAVLRDVTDRRQAERELRDMNQQLRGLSTSLQNVREQERTRIARELHDELGQQLTGLKLELAWLMNRIKEEKPLTMDKIEGMRQGVDQAIRSVRQISSELRPVMLDDLGFGEAVSWQVSEFTKRTGIQVELHLDALEHVEHPDLATALFRIVQESLTNVMRYANASLVTIELLNDGSNLLLRICDDGVGLPEEFASKGFGLVSMRERANSLGGKFSVANNEAIADRENKLPKGTCVEVSFSLDLPMFLERDA